MALALSTRRDTTLKIFLASTMNWFSAMTQEYRVQHAEAHPPQPSRFYADIYKTSHALLISGNAIIPDKTTSRHHAALLLPSSYEPRDLFGREKDDPPPLELPRPELKPPPLPPAPLPPPLPPRSPKPPLPLGAPRPAPRPPRPPRMPPRESPAGFLTFVVPGGGFGFGRNLSSHISTLTCIPHLSNT